MDKKKIIITTIVLLFGLGTFVFANPDDNLDENSKENSYYKEQETNNDSSTDTTQESVINEHNNINNVPNNATNNVPVVTPNFTIPTINQQLNTNNNTTDQTNNNGINDQNTTNINNNSNNSSNGNSNVNGNNNNNGNGNSSNTGGTIEKEEPKPPVLIVENIGEINKVVDNLKSKIEHATKREDILLAREYRDKNKLNDTVPKINDINEKNKLESSLNDLNAILDDDTAPLVEGITNLQYTSTAVSLTINEPTKQVILNGEDISDNLTLLQNITEEKTYTLIVIDNAYNETKVTFTIDKTAPTINVVVNNTTVFINSNEILQPVKDWKLSNDKKTLSRTFNENTTESQILEVKDLAGNKAIATYEITTINFERPYVTENNIIYSTKELTNGEVVVTFRVSKAVFAPDGWTPSERYTEFSKTFTENEKEVVCLRDIFGNTNTVNIVVNNIDKDEPITDINYSIPQNIKTNKRVDVIITSNEKIKQPQDTTWVLAEDQLSIKKSFFKNIEQNLEIEDIAGNKTYIPFAVSNIDSYLDGIVVATSNNDVSTSSNVTVSIISPKELKEAIGWKLSKDKKTLSKTFNEVTRDILEINTEDGTTYIVEYEVKNIDKSAPYVKESDIIYEPTEDGGVLVTFRVSKSIHLPAGGWQASEGYRVFTKKYTASADEIVYLRDIFGNTNKVNIKVDLKAIKQIEEFVAENNNVFNNLTKNIF